MSHFVYLPRGALQIKCTCCLIHRLNRQLLQSARAHAPAARARPHNLGCKHAGARDEYGDEDETSLQIFGLRGWRWSRGRRGREAGEGREAGGEAAKSVANRRRLGPCSFVHVSAVQMSTRLTARKMHANVCRHCCLLSRVGVDLKLLSVGCETTLCASLVPSTPPLLSHVRVCECQTI